MCRCPHIVSKRAGFESYDLCGLTESDRIKPCLLVSGDVCEEWEKIKQENQQAWDKCVRREKQNG